MRKIDGIRGIKKSKLNRADYIRKLMREDRTGAVRATVAWMLAEEDRKTKAERK